MDFKLRMVPTRDFMRQVRYEMEERNDPRIPDLVLTTLAAAQEIRSRIYEPIYWQYGVSEGNASLMLALAGKGKMGVRELSDALGVAPATTSVMVKRMRQRERPLVEISEDERDKRAKYVSLSDEGKTFITTVLLPTLNIRMKDFTQALDSSEQEQLIALLNKLLSVG